MSSPKAGTHGALTRFEERALELAKIAHLRTQVAMLTADLRKARGRVARWAVLGELARCEIQLRCLGEV